VFVCCLINILVTFVEYLSVFSHLITFHDPYLSTHLDSIGFIPDVSLLLSVSLFSNEIRVFMYHHCWAFSHFMSNIMLLLSMILFMWCWLYFCGCVAAVCDTVVSNNVCTLVLFSSYIFVHKTYIWWSICVIDCFSGCFISASLPHCRCWDLFVVFSSTGCSLIELIIYRVGQINEGHTFQQLNFRSAAAASLFLVENKAI